MANPDTFTPDQLRDELARLRIQCNQAQQLLAAHLAVTTEVVVHLCQRDRVADFNSQALSLFGWEQVQVCGKSISELVVAEQERDAFLARIDRCYAIEQNQSNRVASTHGVGTRFPTVVVDRFGQSRSAEFSVIPLGEPGDGTCSLVLSVDEDHDLSKQALLEKESQLSAILQFAGEGIFGLNLACECTFANKACAEILGYADPNEFVGQNMHQMIHHSDSQGRPMTTDECKVCKAFRDGERVHMDGELLWRKDGTSFPAEFWLTPISRGKELTGAVVTFVDITERHHRQLAQVRTQIQLEKQVDASESQLVQVRGRLSMTLTRANVGLWDWDAKTDEVYFSPTYKTQLGFAEDADFRDFDAWKSRLHPDDVEGALERVKEYFERKTSSYRSTFRMRCADGSYRWLLAQGKADFDTEGKPVHVMGVHIDITDQVNSEQELQRLNEALRESNVELQQFASVASHDLQAPLRGIVGFARCLQDDYGGQLDELADDYIHRIVRSASRMQRLIEDLLSYSRVETRAEPHQPTKLNSAFDDAVQMLETSIDAGNAVVTRDDLPTVMGDPGQLSQLFQNLVGNGIKYHEGNVPRVHVSAHLVDTQWTIAVKDNGIGIEPKYHDRVFEIFRRLHTQANYSGTGIGLALCRRIVNRHGGRIWVESKIGEGSTFYFTIPQHT